MYELKVCGKKEEHIDFLEIEQMMDRLSGKPLKGHTNDYI
ncbi:hypothetical protein SAMN02910406_02012 [Ruminococcus albus]|uniref:Uncharacterized protein n=1 Tax=Ruminococcus albus TaxID=1264 RepID=A0A1I1KH24_RUMAL|nr:hypothetical protein SAMN02910406_02012 [Ruminococcus albus]